MEDWHGIAAEVAEAIRSVSDASQPDGYPVALRFPGTQTGPEWDPVIGPPTYRTLHAIEGFKEIRDQSGTLIGQTRHTLTVTADPLAVPGKSLSVALGITADEANEESQWIEIIEVRPLSPAGVAVLYEIDLVD